MQLLRSRWDETILHIVVESKVPLDQFVEVFDDIVRIFIQQSLQFAYGFELVEILLKLCIQVCENFYVLFQHVDLFICPLLTRND